MSVVKLSVHTDILVDHLTHGGNGPSTLRIVMAKCFCYTTVFTAIELFSLALTARERRYVAQAMNAMKILGLNAKSAMKFGEFYGDRASASTLHVLSAGVCVESRLPILTNRPQELLGVPGVKVIRGATVTIGATPAEILSTATLLS